jgi:hypothetical protein
MHDGATDAYWAMNNGAMNNRTMNNRTVDNWAMDNWAVDHGSAVKGWSMADWSVDDGPVPGRPMRSGVRRRPFVAAAACAYLRKGQCRDREHQRRGNG